jgi:hypothetical protein
MGARFSAPVQTEPEAHPAYYTIGTASFPRVKRPERAVDHPLPSSAQVKERVELYLYSPSGSSRPVKGWNLTLAVALCKGTQFSHQLVWLLGAYRLPKLFELNMCLEESTPCNCRAKLQYFFWNIFLTVLRYCNETNIRGTWFVDLFCSFCYQKVPICFICVAHSFVLYSKYTDLNRKFLQMDKINAKTFLCLMRHVLKVFCSCALILITFLNTHCLFHIHVIAPQQEFFCHVMLDTGLISVLSSLDLTAPNRVEWVIEIHSCDPNFLLSRNKITMLTKFN